MYSSDLIRRNQAQIIYTNLQMQQNMFTDGKSVRIQRGLGGIDYSYMALLEEGIIEDTTWKIQVPIYISHVDGPIPTETDTMPRVSFVGITDAGSLPRDSSGNVLSQFLDSSGNKSVIDDGSILIEMGGMDFFFFGINYGATNNIFWNTNNAITFGEIPNRNTVSISKGTVPAILLGNYDRYCSAVYSANYMTAGNKFAITKFIVYFSNYYTDVTGLAAGKYQIRLIREEGGSNRQWVEVSVISSVSSPGYSNNRAVTYPSGYDSSGNPLDSNSNPIDSTKNSPYDITNGTSFQNVVRSTFSTVSPEAGTTFIYQSDSTGSIWEFVNNAYLNV
jgi:hypothetical protein